MEGQGKKVLGFLNKHKKPLITLIIIIIIGIVINSLYVKLQNAVKVTTKTSILSEEKLFAIEETPKMKLYVKKTTKNKKKYYEFITFTKNTYKKMWLPVNVVKIEPLKNKKQQPKIKKAKKEYFIHVFDSSFTPGQESGFLEKTVASTKKYGNYRTSTFYIAYLPPENLK